MNKYIVFFVKEVPKVKHKIIFADSYFDALLKFNNYRYYGSDCFISLKRAILETDGYIVDVIQLSDDLPKYTTVSPLDTIKLKLARTRRPGTVLQKQVAQFNSEARVQ